MSGDKSSVVCLRCNAKNTENAIECQQCGVRLFSDKPATVTAAQFTHQVNDSGIAVLALFSAPWCNPCQIMTPIFERAAAELEPVMRLIKVDIDAEQALAEEYGIQSVPTMVLYRGGWEVGRIAGAMDMTRMLSWVESTTSRLR